MCEYGVIVPLKNELEDQLSFQNVITQSKLFQSFL